MLVEREEQRFDLSPDRDSDTWRVTPGLTFNPDGLLTGSASVGYRHFQPLSPTLPDYTGLVSAVTIGATLYSRHQLQGVFNRDVQYSYDEATDYYLGTTAARHLDDVCSSDRSTCAAPAGASMDYRDVSEADRTDVMNTYGGGVGYRFGSRARAELQRGLVAP